MNCANLAGDVNLLIHSHLARMSEDRMELMANYFQVELPALQRILDLPKDERRRVCQEMGVHPYVFRAMADYTRYFEAEQISRALLRQGIKISGMNVLDFGCLVSDYGMHFARLNAIVSVYDEAEVIKFVNYRFARERLPVKSFVIPHDLAALMAGIDLAIFGEVLEHLGNPLLVLENCLHQNVRFLFTSRFPFGDDKYYALPGHRKTAQASQPDCIRLLDGHYQRFPLHRKAVLWRRKGI